MIKLVAFDWNGTILSDAAAMSYADNKVLQHYGFRSVSLAEYRKYFTIPIRKYWIDIGFDADFFDKNSEEIHRIFLNFYEPLEARCRSRTGARNILNWLDHKGIESIIFSNHIIPHIEKQLKRLKLYSLIKYILARNTREDSSHMLARGKDVKLRDFVKPHQMKSTVALTSGHQSLSRLKVAKPDFLIHNLKDLKEIISAINGSSLLHGRAKVK